MSISLEGRSVLVTGGSRGIGRAVVEAASEAGAFVHVLSRDPDPVAEVARRSGGAVWPADLADDAVVWSALDALRENLGGEPWAVVNAAGAFEVADFTDTSVSAFDRMLSINLRGTFLVIRAVLPGLLARRSGRIVNVGSVAGRRAFPGNAAYGASKFGVRGMHEVLLEELRGSGVTATLVEPAATDTPLWDPLDPDADPAMPSRSEMLQPGDVADAVLFALTRPEGVRIPLLQIERG